MKKVININFQGRVIPIEETAYELLKQYIESLRIYFAKEEGRDEIINDIEGRIAELFSEKLKGGVSCITDDDVNAIIAAMGRPEDFEAEEGETTTASSSGSKTGAGASSGPSYQQTTTGRGRLYRNTDDKILAGVCSGLANYLGIDPVIMRILFVVFLGVLLWVYILLWIIVPAKSVQSNITKRLYRSADQRVIGGVAGGIAAYFNIEVWVPRLIFVLPFLLGLISSGFDAMFWDWHFGFAPRVISGSFGGTMFITYIVLWIAVPVAHSAAEKLEMRGERVDVNSIANTVKEDLIQFRSKAEKWGEEVKQSAKDFGKQASAHAKTFSHEAGYVARKTGTGLGHAIGVLIKALFIFIFTIVAIVLFSVFVFVLFGGVALAPLKDFVLENRFQNILAWMTLFLFFMVPLIALVTWGVRRIMGVRSRKHYVGLAFGTLWVLGWISAALLFVQVARNFKNNARLEEREVATISSKGPVNVEMEKADWRRFNNEFFGIDVDDDWPFYSVGDDSIMINTVSLNMAKSKDSLYHVYVVKQSRGSSRNKATTAAEKVEFAPVVNDSLVSLPQGFFIGKTDKFRNQRVTVVFEIPVGKRIRFDYNISNYSRFSMRDHDNFYYDDDDWDDWSHTSRPEPGKEYIMNSNGRAERVTSL
jgi:phage shock protein PspC (stress-responsive transcriptional regulator)